MKIYPLEKKIARQWSEQCQKRWRPDDWGDQWLKALGTRREVTLGSVFALADRLDPKPKALPHLTDIKNGKLYADKWRDSLFFVKGWKGVIVLDPEIGYTKKDFDFAITAGKEVVADMLDDYTSEFRKDPDATVTKKMGQEIRRVSQLKNLKAMIEMARSEDRMSISLSELDADPMLLGVKNGVVDLTTGKLTEITPNLLVTKRSNFRYVPSADAPRFKKFIQEIEPDKDKQIFLLCLLAYLLTGSVKEQFWFFFMGIGANGKSVLIEFIAWCLGDYAFKIPTEMLMKQNRSSASASPDLLALQGRRLVYCNETTEGQRIDDARVKDMTGGDTITARALYQDPVSFRPTHKLVVSGNHAPIVSDNGEGFWRRVKLFEFTQRFEGKDDDKELLTKLQQESSGVLNLLLTSLKIWNESGLPEVKALTDATNNYRSDQDLIQDFLSSETATGAKLSIRKDRLYGKYKVWADDSGVRALSRQRFSRKITDKGYITSSCHRLFEGLGSNSNY
jgi:putative DNA primase/helicase